MIRSILIFAYIVAVLLVSGLARADYAQVKSVSFDQQTYLMHIQGVFTTACQSRPRPELVEILTSGPSQVALVGVKVDQPADAVCAQVITGRYDLVFDVRALALPVGTDLEIKFKNFEAITHNPMVMRIDSQVNGLHFASIELAGLLVQMSTLGSELSTEYALVGKQGDVTYIRSLVDLSDYVNSWVSVSGIPLQAAIAPQLDTRPGIELVKRTDSGKTPNLVFATEISFMPLQ